MGQGLSPIKSVGLDPGRLDRGNNTISLRFRRNSGMSTHHGPTTRRSDLDALRAAAMLLGIVLHASLSFFPSAWMVSDDRQDHRFGILFSAIHGFRMPVFFVMSGYFSAMLLHTRGRWALVRHRFRRVFLPLLAGMFTIVPLTVGISTIAISIAVPKPALPPASETASNIWTAAKTGHLEAIQRALSSGAAVEDRDPELGGTALHWAAITGQAEAIRLLLEQGANVTAADRDGATALHAAAFLGHVEAVQVLLDHGAEVNAANHRGVTPLETAILDEATTRYVASLLQLELDEEQLGKRKAAIANILRQHGGTVGRAAGGVELLMRMPLFHHLWFLWFLWWLVLGYAAVSATASRLTTAIRWPSGLVHSPVCLLWLIPLTMIPQWFMSDGGAVPIFGPDTSTGLLPIPHVLAYYAIFFGFGTLVHSAGDCPRSLGKHWWLSLPFGLFLLLPLGLALLERLEDAIAAGSSSLGLKLLATFVLAAYPWSMTFGLMGFFQHMCPAESPRLQYLSDSAYWLYLAHLPLIIAAQMAVRDWPIPAIAKFALIVIVATAFLLWTYQVVVRYTWLGRFLNGRRIRPSPAVASATSAS